MVLPMMRLPRLTSLPVLGAAFLLVTVLTASGALRNLDEQLQAYWSRRYTPNWHHFLDSVPNAVAGQAVCLPVLLAVAIWFAVRFRTWHPLVIAAAAEVAFFGGIGGLKLLLARTSPAVGDGSFFTGGFLEYGRYGMAYPSGHAAEAVLIYGAAAYLIRAYAHPDHRSSGRTFWFVTLITIGAIAVAFYLGFHWPTDLVGGLLAGGFLLRLIVECDRRYFSGSPGRKGSGQATTG